MLFFKLKLFITEWPKNKYIFKNPTLYFSSFEKVIIFKKLLVRQVKARKKEKRKAKEKVDVFGERRHGKGWSWGRR